jgi:serine/threonine protein kinase
MSLPGQPLNDDGASTQVLASILSDIDALECLQKFIEFDQDDSTIGHLIDIGKMNPSKYGISLEKCAAFVEKCREKLSVTGGSLPAPSLVGSSPVPLSASPADILHKLNLEILSELGRGSFGIVFLCKSLTDKLKVAVKLVLDPSNAKEAMREGQKLSNVDHKNIVRVRKVHNLDSVGFGTCALEMEVVPGGDLLQHLEACRQRTVRRLPHDAVLRFSRQLLGALAYLHDTKNWLHGDIKPQNILMDCMPAPADGSPIDYSSADIKLSDFGLAKVIDRENSSASFMLTSKSTKKGVVKGTLWYLSPEALQGASSDYERTYSDDIWSVCLVIYEMDTGLTLQQLMTAPGAIKLDELLTKTSPELLPLLASVLAFPDAALRCKSAAELLQKLDASLDPLYIWEKYDTTADKYERMHHAASFYLETAFLANKPLGQLPLQPPLDLIFNIEDLLSSATALGSATGCTSNAQCTIRRMLNSSALACRSAIPIWQQLVDGKEWLQCSPAMCAKFEIDYKNQRIALDATSHRRIIIESGSIGSAQLPHLLNSEPYLATVQPNDFAVLSKRVHESLPEWDITDALQVVNSTLASKYADRRHRLAELCNGNPNEKMLFHFARDDVIPKIWQAGEGLESRLSQWSEVGQGAYFAENIIYNYAYKYGLWGPPETFKEVAEPPVGEEMRIFAVLACLGDVADMDFGCESCPSREFLQWREEYQYFKRPPVIPYPPGADKKKHLLDRLQVKDGPRYHSVLSTEGNLATHPKSTCKTPSGPMRDVLHPRLKANAKEWGKQYVLFEFSSYPMFLLTVKKNRCSPMGPQQLLDEGCDLNRLKVLGCTASVFKALGKTVHEMRAMGWKCSDLKDSKYDLQLLSREFKASDLKNAGFTVKDLQDAGLDLEFISEGFTPTELKNSGYSLRDMQMISREFKASDLKNAGFTIEEFKDAGLDLEFISEGFTPTELKNSGYSLRDMQMISRKFKARDLKNAGFTIEEFKDAGLDLEFISKGFDVKELKNSGYGLNSLKEHFKRRDLETVFNDYELEKEGIMKTVDIRKFLFDFAADHLKLLFPLSHNQDFQREKDNLSLFIASILFHCGLVIGCYFTVIEGREANAIYEKMEEMRAINASLPSGDWGPGTGYNVLLFCLFAIGLCSTPFFVLTFRGFARLMCDVIFLLPFTFPSYTILLLLRLFAFLFYSLTMLLSYLSYVFKAHCFTSPKQIHPQHTSED